MANTYIVCEQNGDAKAEVFQGKDGLFYLVDIGSDAAPLGPFNTIDRAVDCAEGLDVDAWLDRFVDAERREAETAYAQSKGWA
jgi:hypothetical protein